MLDIDVFIEKTNKKSRLIGIDPGKKRIGIAISDENKIVATPYTTIIKENYRDLVSQIRKIVDEYKIDGIVIGNPLNMDGTEGPSSQSAKDFAKHGEAFKFINKHFDDYGTFPSSDTLVENYPTIDITANSLNLDYAIDSFKNQVLFRTIVSAFQSNKELLKEDAKKALSI